MRAVGWLMVSGFAWAGCSTQLGDGSGSVGATRSLTLKVQGSGQVRATNPAFSCKGECKLDLAPGTPVTLIALPDSGFHFDGWEGDCGGANDCTLRLDANRAVGAIFSRLGPPSPGAVRVSVTFTGNGTGRVTSSPAGISCPGSCSMDVTTGVSVTMEGRADSGSTFAGFGGACSGPKCTFDARSDAQVYADFEVTPPPPPPPPLPPECNGLAPAAISPVVAAQHAGASCSNGMGDGQVTVALETHGASSGVELYFHNEGDGALKGNTVGELRNFTGGFTQQPNGFTAILRSAAERRSFSGHFYMPPPQDAAKHGTTMFGDAGFQPLSGGGLIVAGDFNTSSAAPIRHQVAKMAEDTSVLWARDLAAKGPMFGLGGDASDNVIVITGGGSGSITAQWFDRQGNPLTGEFVVLASFSPGYNTWFEVAPLIGSGVAMRRVDQQDDASGRPYRTSAWLAVLPTGMASPQDVPLWLKDRPNTNLDIARSGKAYAFLPLGAPDADCGQKIEIVAPNGTACGSFDASIGTGKCRTEDLNLGRNDTPIQLMPASTSPAGACSWRWWPRALK